MTDEIKHPLDRSLEQIRESIKALEARVVSLEVHIKALRARDTGFITQSEMEKNTSGRA